MRDKRSRRGKLGERQCATDIQNHSPGEHVGSVSSTKDSSSLWKGELWGQGRWGQAAIVHRIVLSILGDLPTRTPHSGPQNQDK